MFCSICTFVLVFCINLWELIRNLKIAKTWPCLFKSWREGRMCHRLDQTSFALKGYKRWKLTVRKQKKNANVNHSIFSFNYTIKYFNFFFQLKPVVSQWIIQPTIPSQSFAQFYSFDIYWMCYHHWLSSLTTFFVHC